MLALIDLGEKYRSQSSTSSRQAPRLPAPAPHAEHAEQPHEEQWGAGALEEDVWMEVFLRRAAEEREEALRLQEEVQYQPHTHTHTHTHTLQRHTIEKI